MKDRTKRLAGAAALSITAVAAAMGIAQAVDDKESGKGSFKGNDEELKGSYQGAFFKGPSKGKAKFTAVETDFGKGAGVLVTVTDDVDGDTNDELFFPGAELQALDSGFDSLKSMNAVFIVSFSTGGFDAKIEIAVGPLGSDASVTLNV